MPIPPTLHILIDCELGETCFIQQHMDRDPGPDARDYQCGTLCYGDHTVTDFRLRDFSNMDTGVDVLAATAGIIRALRNSAPDTGRDHMIEGQECGNGVILEHEDGGQTQYCHMQQGSIIVEQRQGVRPGDPHPGRHHLA